MTILIDLPRGIGPSLASEIEQEAAFVSAIPKQLTVRENLDSMAVGQSDNSQEAVLCEKLDQFDLNTEDEIAFSSGVALGLERGVLAAFTQYGFDPARQHVGVRKEIFG